MLEHREVCLIVLLPTARSALGHCFLPCYAYLLGPPESIMLLSIRANLCPEDLCVWLDGSSCDSSLCTQQSSCGTAVADAMSQGPTTRRLPADEHPTRSDTGWSDAWESQCRPLAVALVPAEMYSTLGSLVVGGRPCGRSLRCVSNRARASSSASSGPWRVPCTAQESDSTKLYPVMLKA